MRILIADDDPTSREIACHLAAHTGHEAVAVADGASALTALLAGGFGAALLDLHMPLVGGAEVAQAVAAALPAGSRPRLIALTAAVGPGAEVELLARGFDACLAKPLRPPTLAAALTGAEAPLAALAPPAPLAPPTTAVDVAALLAAHADGDSAALASHAVRLKVAAAVGHPMLAALCARLERAVAYGDATSVAELVAAIATQAGRG
jgi:two-component system sensor histidine kinase/response regulator